MTRQQIENIIKGFFGRHFSEATQMRFRIWLGIPTDQEDKDSVLEEIWKESPNNISFRTLEDYKELDHRIHANASAHSHFHIQQWMKYAAVVMLMILTGITVHYLPGHNEQVIKAVEYAEVYVPNGETREVLLADGSKVSVNAGSILIYPKSFDGDTRMLYLNGEARFEVAKNPEKPFIVNTPLVNVTALGTIFRVEAYPESKKTVAILEDGAIRFDTKNAHPHSDILKPLERLIYYHDTDLLTKDQIEQTYLTAMRKGTLVFEDATFDEIVTAMERRYDVRINYDGKKYKGHSYNVKFLPGENLDEALLIMGRLIDDFAYTQVNNTISIK